MVSSCRTKVHFKFDLCFKAKRTFTWTPTNKQTNLSASYALGCIGGMYFWSQALSQTRWWQTESSECDSQLYIWFVWLCVVRCPGRRLGLPIALLEIWGDKCAVHRRQLVRCQTNQLDLYVIYRMLYSDARTQPGGLVTIGMSHWAVLLGDANHVSLRLVWDIP